MKLKKMMEMETRAKMKLKMHMKLGMKMGMKMRMTMDMKLQLELDLKKMKMKAPIVRKKAMKDKMVMSMVVKVMVGEKLHEGKVWRYIFDSEFMANLRDKKLRWSVFKDAKMLMLDELGYNLGNCDYLFLAMLVFNHWFCYCANLKNDKFFILDLLAGKLFKEKMMAGFMRTSIIELLQACDPEKYGEDF
ncbi:uncharacterized protein LOC129316267 [Prosopis cineraria]|uniref:uncharacterized protein LOC129316267 n=1 Tax=Prosopis cineraria TaxID=364024 RepID=UPI00240EBF56|nr:uncharacterized protein LOC129316267 [Prosopis cineraria]XP_054816575.1 uncharacterized protein LOC129316267 [Prosopis cineraria]XP_054816576.1 uncharacterized protein LOC129316267 [Prosopis cineraria]